MSGRPKREIWRHGAVLGFVPRAAPNVQRLAIKNYRLWQRDPHHPSLHFRRLQGDGDRFTIRVGEHYRALGRRTTDTVTWVWIGSHSEYDRLVSSE